MTAVVHATWNWWCDACAEGGEEEYLSSDMAERDAEAHDIENEHGVSS